MTHLYLAAAWSILFLLDIMMMCSGSEASWMQTVFATTCVIFTELELYHERKNR